jgi:hypothetical protein
MLNNISNKFTKVSGFVDFDGLVITQDNKPKTFSLINKQCRDDKSVSNGFGLFDLVKKDMADGKF